MATLSSSIGEPLTVARHVRGAWGLGELFDQPFEVNVQTDSAGNYTVALANQTWDYLSLQPYDESLDEAKRGANQFIDFFRQNPGNLDARIVLYQAWPSKPSVEATYASRWMAVSDGTSASWATRDYWNSLLADVNSRPGNPMVEVVPVGEVIYVLDEAIRNGSVPQLTSTEQLYRDNVHFNGIGRYLAAVTHLTVMHRRNLVDEMPATTIYNLDGGIPSPELQRYFRQLAWDVVSTHPYVVIPEPASLGVLAAVALIFTRRRR